MSLSQRLFSEAFRDIQRAMTTFEQPLLNSVGPLLVSRYPATEKPDAYELKADLPGFDKGNIKIELADSRTLVLTGTVQEETASNINTEEGQVVAKMEGQLSEYKPQFWVNERVAASFARAFQFPTPIRAEDIKASFDNGVLKVLVPKAVEDQPKKIDIE